MIRATCIFDNPWNSPRAVPRAVKNPCRPNQIMLLLYWWGSHQKIQIKFNFDLAVAMAINHNFGVTDIFLLRFPFKCALAKAKINPASRQALIQI